jgi:hypothetical protein
MKQLFLGTRQMEDQRKSKVTDTVTVVSAKCIILWDMNPSSLVKVYRRLRRISVNVYQATQSHHTR